VTETFACPACGETERLAGRRDGHDVLIRCEACGDEWRRDLDVCPSCGSRTIAGNVNVPLNLFSYTAGRLRAPSGTPSVAAEATLEL